MCDYSLMHVKSRPAAVGDKLTTWNFGTGTRGFTSEADAHNAAVCLLPGTELAFEQPVEVYGAEGKRSATVTFRQLNKDNPRMHHDCLEHTDGTQTLLTYLVEGQKATVLQLPAQPKNEAEVEEQRRVEVVA